MIGARACVLPLFLSCLVSLCGCASSAPEADAPPAAQSEATLEESLRRDLSRLPYGPPPGLGSEVFLPDGAVGVTPPQEVHDALCAHLAEFFALQAQGDPYAFERWMNSRGYWFSMHGEEIEDAKEGWERFTGVEAPADLSPKRMFHELFARSISWNHRRVAPTGLDRSATADRVRYLRVTEKTDISNVSTLFLRSPEDIRDWVGEGVVIVKPLWAPPTSPERIVNRDGDALLSLATLTLATETGSPLKTLLMLFYDPRSVQWHIRLIGVNDAPEVFHGMWRL